METKKQKLGKRNTYTPTDASQVCSSVVMSLNREETLSEHDLKTFSNNLDENLPQHTEGLMVKVYVLNMEGKPLMPCKPAKARHLLKDKKAEVVTRNPFTIRLLFECDNGTQPITLGIDTGVKNIGFSATTEKEELICGELQLRTDISKKLQERTMYRRNKRNKLWYRQPRFNNRTRTKKTGWLAPSVLHKIDSHIRLITKIKSLIPISNVIIESSQFDAQNLQNPEISGTEYQQGQMLGWENTKMFVRHRDNYTCQICKKKDDRTLDVHHITQRKDGGSDRPDNLTVLHQKCHIDFHSGKIKHTFTKPKLYKETAMMNSLWSMLVKNLDCQETYGYVTKIKRKQLSLEKTHYNDAFVISGGEHQIRTKPMFSKQIRRNNRCLQLNRKGFKPSIRKQRYKLQPNDLVRFDGKEMRVKGVHSYGRYLILSDGENIINKNVQKIELVTYGKGLSFSLGNSSTTKQSSGGGLLA